jgi:hypothetical protein
MTIELTPGSMSNPEKVSMSFDYLIVRPRKIIVQLKFENPLFISQYAEDPDTIKVAFNDEYLFTAENGLQLEKELNLSKQVPSQLPNSINAA